METSISSTGFIHQGNQTDLQTEAENSNDKIYQIFSNYFKLDDDSTKLQVNNFLCIQSTMIDKNCIYLDKTENFPYETLISQDFIFCILAKVGEGSYSLVYKTAVFVRKKLQFNTLKFSSDKVKIIALKKAKNQKSPHAIEKDTIDRLQLSNLTCLDYPFLTFHDQNGTHYSVNKLYTSDIRRVDFQNLTNPLNAIVRIIISSANLLEQLHQRNYIHRDIKGDNILVSFRGNSVKSAAVTDFDLLREEMCNDEFTTGTVRFLDPHMFGNVENTLLNQKKRVGRQTKQGDIYALGKTIIYDFLIRFFLKKTSHSINKDSITSLINQLSFKTWAISSLDPDLKEIGKQYPHRAVYCDATLSIVAYPSRQEIRQYLYSIIELATDCFNSQARDILHKISHVACCMLHDDSQKRPTSHLVRKQFENIFQILHHRSLQFVIFNPKNNAMGNMLYIFNESIQKIAKAHSQDVIYRDIKSSHIIIITDQDSYRVKIANFGLKGKEGKVVNKTNGTAFYLDPGMFGTVQGTLINQKDRYGLQTKEGDIYALSVTFIYDVLIPFFEEIANLMNQNGNLLEQLQKIKVRKVKCDGSNQQLLQLAEEYPFRAIYNDAHETIDLFPELEIVKQSLVGCLTFIPDTLISITEKELFVYFIQLLCAMQDYNLKKRPTAQMIQKDLFELTQMLHSPQAKRIKRKAEVNVDQTSNKRRATQDEQLKK